MLRAAGVAFRASPADLDEARLMEDLQARGATTAEIAVRLAAQKAMAVSRQEPGALVLGGDTVVMFQGDLIGKCPDMAGVEALLRRAPALVTTEKDWLNLPVRFQTDARIPAVPIRVEVNDGAELIKQVAALLQAARERA